MSDWLSIVIGPISFLLGIAVSEFRQWRQERDKYKSMTFEKRLEVHQEAYRISSEVGRLFFDILTGEMPTEGDLRSKVMEMREWWRSNCLLLDKVSRKAFLGLTNAVETYAESYDPEDASKCLELAKEANKTITEGIGEQYLPDTQHKNKAR